MELASTNPPPQLVPQEYATRILHARDEMNFYQRRSREAERVYNELLSNAGLVDISLAVLGTPQQRQELHLAMPAFAHPVITRVLQSVLPPTPENQAVIDELCSGRYIDRDDTDAIIAEMVTNIRQRLTPKGPDEPDTHRSPSQSHEG